MELGHDFRHVKAVAVVPRACQPGWKRDEDSWQRRVLILERVAMLRQDLQPGRQVHRLIGGLGERRIRCCDTDRSEERRVGKGWKSRRVPECRTRETQGGS